MSGVKRNVKLDDGLALRLEDFQSKNPGFSFTQIVHQAITSWLDNPNISETTSRKTDEKDVMKFLHENSDLMVSLSK